MSKSDSLLQAGKFGFGGLGTILSATGVGFIQGEKFWEGLILVGIGIICWLFRYFIIYKLKFFNQSK